MENFDRKKHWENIYQTKELKDVSWYQPIPQTSLDFVQQNNIPVNAKIIDIGGGDSFLVDYLIDEGYKDITVLDISEEALLRAKKRLGDKADQVKWIVADAAAFSPTEQYDFWHDRAAFHFLTDEKEIASYLNAVNKGVCANGTLLVGSFSVNGPVKCSGIDVKQYSEFSLSERFKEHFEKLKCITVDHKTPFNTIQNFVFCSFRKLPV